MALAISDLQYDLLTLVRTYDRANDFARADEYRAMLDRVEDQDRTTDTLYDALYNIERETGHALADIDGQTLTADHADRLAIVLHRIAAIVQRTQETV